MLPFVFVGRLTIPTYGLMLALAFVGAGIVFILLAPRAKLPRPDALNLVSLVLVGALAGAKLLYLLSIIPSWPGLIAGGSDLIIAELAGGGMVFYGGLLGGLLAFLFYLKKYNLPLVASMDIGAVALPLGQAIGRIGCFCVGCCYGVPWDRGIVLKYSPIAPNTIPLFPTQLIESAFCLLLSIVLYLLLRRYAGRGLVSRVYLVSYSVFRFILEFWRGDQKRGIIGPFSLAQWISLLILLFLLILWIRSLKLKGDFS